VESIYDKYDCEGITLWLNNCINSENHKEIRIEYNKFLFFGELTVKGIDSRVCVQ